MSRGKLRAALAAEKGVDVQKLRQHKKHRQKLKDKAQSSRSGDVEESLEELDEVDESGNESDNEDKDLLPFIEEMAEEDSEEDDEDEDAGVDIGALDDSDSDSDIEMDGPINDPGVKSLKKRATGSKKKVDEEDELEEDDEEDLAWSDLDDLDEEERADLIPHQRQTINNSTALLASLHRIQMPTGPEVEFKLHQSVTGSTPTADSIPDAMDDLNRELQFYRQALEAAKQGRTMLKKEGVPFSRPNDYFAEMVKDDGHMEKVKAKLIEEASAKKASTEARKQRDLRKFGKQVQVAKEQERNKEKKATLDKIKLLKRKRQESSHELPEQEGDMFDVAVDDEIKKHNFRKASGGRGEGTPNRKRQKKDEKFGFGGKKKFAKSGDAMSSGDLSGFSVKGMKGAKGKGGKGAKATRPGKARRKSMRS